MGETYFMVYPETPQDYATVLREARQDGIQVDICRGGLQGSGLLFCIPARWTGWDDLGTERLYRRLAGERL